MLEIEIEFDQTLKRKKVNLREIRLLVAVDFFILVASGAQEVAAILRIRPTIQSRL